MAYDSTKDNLEFFPKDTSSPGRKAVAVTPHNTNDLDVYAKALYIGTTGNVCVLPVGNDDADTITFVAHPVGYFVAVQVRRVLATGTTASNIIAIYD